MLPTEWRGASDESVKEQYAQRQAGHKQGDHDAADGEDALEIGVLGGDPFGVAEDEACAGGGAGSGHGSGQAKDQQSGDDLGISADEAGKLQSMGVSATKRTVLFINWVKSTASIVIKAYMTKGLCPARRGLSACKMVGVILVSGCMSAVPKGPTAARRQIIFQGMPCAARRAKSSRGFC